MANTDVAVRGPIEGLDQMITELDSKCLSIADAKARAPEIAGKLSRSLQRPVSERHVTIVLLRNFRRSHGWT
jgi:hypothetical protein